MFKSHSSTKKDEFDSKSEALAEGWKTGINLVQQIYIAQQYQTDNGMDLDKEVDNIEGDQLKGLQKKPKRQKNLSSVAEKYTQYRILVRNNKWFQRNSRSDRATDDTLIFV